MNNISQPAYVNMPVYVALSCLIAFAIVITICLLKQFIWDPLLARQFEILRPVISESVRKLSATFYRPQSISNSTLSIDKSMSDSCVQSNESPHLLSEHLMTLPLTDNQINRLNPSLARRSYGSSSLNPYAYTNYGSDDVNDDAIHMCPMLHFSCEYNPLTFSIRLNIQNLRHMNTLLSSCVYVQQQQQQQHAQIFVRFMLKNTITSEPYETSRQKFQDFIRFGETFNILSNIRSRDILNHQIQFLLMLTNEEHVYQLGQSVYSMKDEQLTHILFLERILPMRIDKYDQMAIENDFSPR
jgi:hypothetical protein